MNGDEENRSARFFRAGISLADRQKRILAIFENIGDSHSY